MNEPGNQSAEGPRSCERVAAQLVAQVLFERSRFGRHSRGVSRMTVDRLLDRLSYRRRAGRRVR